MIGKVNNAGHGEERKSEEKDRVCSAMLANCALDSRELACVVVLKGREDILKTNFSVGVSI